MPIFPGGNLAYRHFPFGIFICPSGTAIRIKLRILDFDFTSLNLLHRALNFSEQLLHWDNKCCLRTQRSYRCVKLEASKPGHTCKIIPSVIWNLKEKNLMNMYHRIIISAALILAAVTTPVRPELAMVHSNGVILREDFDSSPDLDPAIW